MIFFFFSISLVFPAALGLGVYSACNRNYYQKQKNEGSGEYSEADAKDFSAICEPIV
jgi:hypothetical protein